MSPEVPIIILIISIPVYFLSKWFFKKLNIGNQNNRKHLAFISTIILSPILYIGIIMLWMFSISYYPNNDFDKKEWANNIEERFKMSNDIIENELLIGKSKKRIIYLLGKDYSSYSENHISYYLGFVPGLFNIDPDYLDIYFENGKVIKVEQRQS